MKIGSLFAGYGGLDGAVQQVFPDARPAWFCEWDDAPSKILAHHWPDVPNHRDVTNVDWSKVEPVDILTGGFPCFTAETPVLTSRGYVPIADVAVGDEVLTHTNTWRKVTHVMNRESETVEFAPGFYSTPEHRFWTRPASRVWNNDARQYRRVLGEACWTEIEDAQGMFLAQPTSVAQHAPAPAMPPGFTYWHLGRWVADGWIAQANGAPIIGIGKSKLDRDLPQFGDDWRRNDEKTVVRMTLRTGGWTEWFATHFGSSASTKTIPAWVLYADECDRREFLRGYWDGDAYLNNGSGMRSVSVSPLLTVGIRTLATTLGYTTAVHYNVVSPRKMIQGREVNQRNWWSMTATPDDGRFTEVIGGHRWSKLRKRPEQSGVRRVYDLTVEVDHSFIAAGFVVHNCQDVSHAGRRQGLIRDGEGKTRSGLWGEMLKAIDTLRPSLVVAENVRGLLSARADSDVEPCPWCVGDDGAGSMRALGAVLADLADIGYDAAWCGLRAADVGAAHGRFRVFILAWPTADVAYSADDRHGRGHRIGRDNQEQSATSIYRTDAAQVNASAVHLLPTPAARDWKDHQVQVASHRPDDKDSINRAIAHLLPTPRATDGTHGGPNQRGSSGDLMLPSAVHQNWGEYADAIARWESTIGRPAPAPTEPGAKGNPRLSPRFVEWLMGLPAGHVTDPAIGLTRNQQLKALGNGVVPAQGAAALRHLLDIRNSDLTTSWKVAA